jgi:CubicO group peptidase (beta-lactamase class C family)
VVKLDEPVVRYLPEFERVRGKWTRRVTLRQLASHTSGLPAKMRDPLGTVGPFAQWQSNAMQALAHARQVWRPGRRFRYSNLGTVTLGLALERAAGKPYVNLVAEHVLAPLGMRRTTFFVPSGQRLAPNLALSEHGAHEHDGRGNRVPSGGLYSTVGELGRLAAALYGAAPQGFLSEHSLRVLATPALEEGKYGLGVRLGKLKGRRTVMHAGGIAGYRAALLVVPDAQMGAAVLQAAGSGDPPPMKLARELLAPLLK